MKNRCEVSGAPPGPVVELCRGCRVQRIKTTACCNVDSVSTLLALVNDAVVLVDLDGAVVGWSRGAEDLLGYSAVDILGRNCAEIYAEDERDAHRERCRRVASGAGTAGFEVTLRTRSGALQAGRVEVALMAGADGTPANLFIHLRDGGGSGARPHVGWSQMREFRALLDGSPVGIWHLDASRRFVYANRCALALAGLEHSDVTGRHVLDVLGEALHEQLLPALDRALGGIEAVAEPEALRGDGGIRHYFVYLLPHRGPDDLVDGCFAAVLDVTQARLAREHQSRREQQLRATLIRETNHRIKNSLQGLIGLLRLQDPHSRSAAEVIEQSVAHLMAVTVALGLASRHGEGQILLCDMVTDIAGNVEQASQRRIQVQLSPAAVREPVLLSERYGVNISLVINELVFNAIKHSANAGGHRGVRVTVDRGSDSAVLRVINEAGQLPAGFSLESGAGLGTGLSLIKALVPPGASRLSIEEGPEGVCAELTLRPPVLAVPGA